MVLDRYNLDSRIENMKENRFKDDLGCGLFRLIMESKVKGCVIRWVIFILDSKFELFIMWYIVSRLIRVWI